MTDNKKTWTILVKKRKVCEYFDNPLTAFSGPDEIFYIPGDTPPAQAVREYHAVRSATYRRQVSLISPREGRTRESWGTCATAQDAKYK